MALRGIDIASYQGALNLASISYDFVLIKATQGTNYVNPYCDADFQAAHAAGKKLAVYHYADGNSSAIDQANFFVDHCVGYIGKAIFVLDWEGTGVEYVSWALLFLKQVEARIGYKPAIYMSESVVNAYNWSSVVANDNGLWCAKYSDYEIDNNYDMSNAGKAPNVKWWPFYFMWQWTSKGHLNGYAGDLDCDIFYGDGAAWDAYAGTPAPAPVPEPTTTTTTLAPPPETPPQAPVEIPVKIVTTTTTAAPVTTTTTTQEPAVQVPWWMVILGVLNEILLILQGRSK